VLPQVSNTMDQAWLTLVQARDVLTLARNALIKARFVAYATWHLMTSRGDWTCKLMWACGLGSAVTDGHIDPRREGHNDTHSRNMSRLPPTVAVAQPTPRALLVGTSSRNAMKPRQHVRPVHCPHSCRGAGGPLTNAEEGG